MNTQPKVILNYATGSRAGGRKLGPLASIVFMAVVLVPLAWLVFGTGMGSHVLSGRLFTDRVEPWSSGDLYGLNPYGIHDRFRLFTVVIGPVLTYVALARWISGRRTRWGYWGFAIPAAVVSLCLLILLTIPFWWLVQYTHSMGFTQKRVYGLIYSALSYLVILGALLWCIWPPKNQ